MEIGFGKDLADDLQRISRRLRSAADAKRLRRELVGALRTAAKPAATAAKQAARSLPDNPGGRSTGLRRRMAAAIGVQVRSGRAAAVKVRVSRARMGDQAGLTKATNVGRWRHPVFGDRDVWVTQESRSLWFDKAVRTGGARTKREIRAVLDDLERRLGK